MQGPSLASFLDAARRHVATLRPDRVSWARRAERAGPGRSFAGALVGGTVAVVAEVKRRSPSEGEINAGLDAAERACAYVAGGARAISVLTEGTFFGGTMDDLAAVAAAVPVPVLRKDFILDELQLLEARVAGASAVLLIVRALDPGRLRDLAAASREVGLDTLVEAHTADEVERALEVRAAVIGVNSRDLESFTVDPGVTERLLPLVPAGVPAVAESGVRGVADVERCAEVGADAVLVGTSLSRARDPEAAVRALTAVARRGRAATGVGRP